MQAPLLPDKEGEPERRHWAAAKLPAAFATTRRRWKHADESVGNMLFLAWVFGIFSGVVAWLYSLYF